MKRVHSCYEAFKSWYDSPVSLMGGGRKHEFGHVTTRAQSVFICYLAQRSKGPIVEFGTFTGRTACDMALNTKQPIYTIDSGGVDNEGYAAYVSGSDFLNVELANRPNLLIGDSRTVAIPVAPHTAGFVFVDGGHSYDVVKSDSARAFDLVRPEGVILWDDYSGSWRGVMQALDEIDQERSLLFFDQDGMVAWGLI
jgi:predicted O-methyltransferase YrrM